jgi:hypothetical protein
MRELFVRLQSTARWRVDEHCLSSDVAIQPDCLPPALLPMNSPSVIASPARRGVAIHLEF